ncbi:hypothetical protein ACIPZ5_24865 [Pseudomonas sp. NPDC089428]|uniref:hypothetical protein n=1 Tax=Pseudomonas sp. NPDC089428 TaxID=3364467 RepID=UPI0037F8EE17
MSSSTKKYSPSEWLRIQFRRAIAAWQRARLPGLQSDLGDLIIDDALLADKDSGLVRSEYLKDDAHDFILSVPKWLFSEKDTLRIEHSRDEQRWTTLYEETKDFLSNPVADPYPIKLDKSKDQMRLQGTHYFRTWIMNDYDDISTSDSLVLIFDTEPPYKHLAPTPFAPVPAVTDASLEAAGGKVILQLPEHKDWEEGDTAYVYWMNRIPDKFEDFDPPVTNVVTTGKGQSVEIDERVVRAVGDGGVFIAYVLVDRAGNVSLPSIYQSVAVALGTLPTVFEDPIVPLATAEDGYLIDQLDADEGIEVWVKADVALKSTDLVVVEWQGTELSGEMVGSAPGEYIRIKVPKDALLNGYGSGPGEVDTKVSYTVRRGTHPMGGADTDIVVNFETLYPGAPDPEWPLPIHPDATKPVVTGQGSGLRDELDDRDTELDAALEFELFDFAETDDTLYFYWGGEAAVTYTVKDTDNAGDLIKVDNVPWGTILKVGNHPAVPVYYEVWRSGVPNPVRSVVTEVKVDAIVIKAPDATFDHLVKDAVTCVSIQATKDHPDGAAVEVLIPDLSEYLKYGKFTKIRVHWWVYRGKNPAEPEVIIEKVTIEEEVDIDEDHPVTGFTYRIPYDTNVLPTYEGSDDPEYTKSRANFEYTILTDEEIPSGVTKVLLAFIPSSGVCDISR